MTNNGQTGIFACMRLKAHQEIFYLGQSGVYFARADNNFYFSMKKCDGGGQHANYVV